MESNTEAHRSKLEYNMYVNRMLNIFNACVQIKLTWNQILKSQPLMSKKVELFISIYSSIKLL